MKDQILKLRSEGKTYRQIASALNISKNVAWRCCNPEKSCDNQKQKRRDFKLRIVKEAGGGCQVCGYNKSMAALDFHHRDPNEKDFSVSDACRRRFPLEKVKSEIKKCILVCSNCHHEIHDGIVSII